MALWRRPWSCKCQVAADSPCAFGHRKEHARAHPKRMVPDESVGFREGNNPRRRAPVKAQCTLCANLHPTPKRSPRSSSPGHGHLQRQLMPANTPKHVGNELMIRRLLVQVPSALMGRDIFRLVVCSLSGRHSTSTSVVAYGACHRNHCGLHG